MQTTPNGTRMSRWPLRSATFLLWVAAAASVAYWALKFTSATGASAVPAPAWQAPAPADPQAVGRLLGAAPPSAIAAAPVPSLSSRFTLLGLVTGGANGGAALLAVDGKPPKPFQLGAQVDEGLILQAVEGRQAMLAPSMEAPATVTLELPPLKR